MLAKVDNVIVDYCGYGLENPEKPATIRSYILDCPEQKKRPAVIICPGGGYEGLSSHEGEPIALKFNSAGFHAFVLEYSVAPMRFPAALLELSKAVAMVRAASEKYQIDSEAIIVCGFSAGGHLAASLGVYWHEGFIQRFLGFDNNENEPNGLILCYPVISNKDGLLHLGSMQNLLGNSPDEKEIELFSLEDNANELVPPTFIWHTYDDDVVSVGNSLTFATALKQYDILTELHIFPHGEHGLGLSSNRSASFLGEIISPCEKWSDMAIRFINEL